MCGQCEACEQGLSLPFGCFNNLQASGEENYFIKCMECLGGETLFAKMNPTKKVTFQDPGSLIIVLDQRSVSSVLNFTTYSG